MTVSFGSARRAAFSATMATVFATSAPTPSRPGRRAFPVQLPRWPVLGRLVAWACTGGQGSTSLPCQALTVSSWKAARRSEVTPRTRMWPRVAGLRSLPLRGEGHLASSRPNAPTASTWRRSDRLVQLWFGNLLLRDGREREWAADDGVTPGRWSSFAEDAAGRLWIRSNDKILVRESGRRGFSRPPQPSHVELHLRHALGAHPSRTDADSA